MWLFYAILSAITAALVAILGKVGLKNVDPTLATTIRAFFMFIIVLGIAVAQKKIQFASLDRTAVFYIFLSGLAGALSWIFYFIALRLGEASKVSAVDRLSIVLVVILAVAFSLEKFSLWKAIGALTMLAGAIMISL